MAGTPVGITRMYVDIENCKVEIEDEFIGFVDSGAENVPEKTSSTDSSIPSYSSVPSKDAAQEEEEVQPSGRRTRRKNVPEKNSSTDSSIPSYSSVPSKDAAQEEEEVQPSGRRTRRRNICGKILPKRKMGPGCERMCRLNCQQNISLEFRKELFKQFWAIGNINLQREYLLKKIKSTTKITKNKRHKHYFLPKSEIRENINIRVCKITFMDTFGINRQWIATIFAKLVGHNMLIPDLRGKRHLNMAPIQLSVEKTMQSKDLIKNIRTAYRRGIEHTNIHGKIVPARKMGPGCGRTCRLKCQHNISVEFRKELFKRFWELGNVNLQREYLLKKIKSTTRTTTRNTTIGKDYKRVGNKHYFLPKAKDCENESIRVCKPMFMNVFGINKQWIATIFAKLDDHNTLTDMRGKHRVKKKRQATCITSVPNSTDGTRNEETKVSLDFDLGTIKEEPDVSFTDEILDLGDNEFNIIQDSIAPAKIVCRCFDTNNLTACTCSHRLILMEDRQDRMEKKLDELLGLVRDISNRIKT